MGFASACRPAMLLLPLVAAAGPLFAGTISGTVELTEKGGRKSSDVSDVIVYVEGARVKPKPTTTSSGSQCSDNGFCGPSSSACNCGLVCRFDAEP